MSSWTEDEAEIADFIMECVKEAKGEIITYRKVYQKLKNYVPDLNPRRISQIVSQLDKHKALKLLVEPYGVFLRERWEGDDEKDVGRDS